MRSIRFGRLAATALVVLAVGMGSGTAVAATGGPTPAERGIAFASPGVVFIRTDAAIKVRLTYQNLKRISGLSRVSKTYETAWVGSGFVVTASGTIVTASHVVDIDLRLARIYGTNQLFNDLLASFGYSFSEPFTKYRITDSGALNRLLQQCYSGVACEFTTTPTVTVYRAVEFAGTQTPQGMPARILTSTGFENTDVAVLQVDGTNLPTVTLAKTAGDLQGGAEVTALGFPGSVQSFPTGITEPTSAFGKVSNIRSIGTSRVIEIDAAIEMGMSGGPVLTEDGEVIGLTSFHTTQSTGESGKKYLRTVDDIRAALAVAGVQPKRGPVDEAFEQAMTYYWGRHYSAAIPLFEKVLALSDGHPLAKQYLADAQTKAGTAKDVPLPKKEEGGKGFPVWIVAAAAAGAVVLLLVVLMLARRGRRTPAPATIAAVPAMPPVAPVPVLPAPAPDTRAVGFQATPAPEAPPAPSTKEPVQASVQDTSAVRLMTAPSGDGQAPRFCPNCGHGVAQATRFCASCGHPVD